MKKSIKIYLIPVCLSKESEVLNEIPFGLKNIIIQLDGVVAENSGICRNVLEKILYKLNVAQEEKLKENLKILQWNEHNKLKDLKYIFNEIKEGEAWGIISEAGMPCIADPGREIVRMAHEKNMEIHPLIGPSSILLALAASGLNGQKFSFHGYISRDQRERIKGLKQMEKTKGTQIFIETPYRNEVVFKDILDNLDGNTDVCVGLDFGMKSEFVKTMKVREWRKKKVDLRKRLGVFLVGGREGQF